MTDHIKEALAYGEQQLESLGLKPLHAARVPTPITDLDLPSLTNAQLVENYGQHVGYAQFLGTRVALVDAALTRATVRRDHHMAEQRVRLKQDGVTEAMLVSTIKSSAEYLELDEKVASAKIAKQILQAYLNNYRAQYAALSRIVSVRQLDIDGVRLGPESRRARGRPRKDGFGHAPPLYQPALEEDEEAEEEEEEEGPAWIDDLDD